jgi:type I restriction enzyme R subunit
MPNFPTSERHLSQLPAIQLLMAMGYDYITPSQTMVQRNGKSSQVILEQILRDQLKKINTLHHKGNTYLFSEENIQTAIQQLKNAPYDGLQRTNEAIYDLLTLGTTLPQVVEGDNRSFSFRYIDWINWENNVFHVTAEYSVDAPKGTGTIPVDIVLFVNGIPVSVIECKSSVIDLDQGISQCIRNQNEDHIPKLFTYVQLVMAVNKNEGKYATVGTPKKFWSLWRELELDEPALESLVNSTLDSTQKKNLFSEVFTDELSIIHSQAIGGYRMVTKQDDLLYSLCRPARLLELIYKFIVVDSGIKKIARYQQYFVVKSTLARVKNFDKGSRRTGGMIWHTQGSGKSLTMVMLARNLALDPEIVNPRIVLVTDRDDLDKQLSNTFTACGLDPKRATSGRNLLSLINEHQATLVTTIINKFDKALNAKNVQELSPDIFMIVDESHRTNFKHLAARMRQMFPNACYLGFTGTPLLKVDKNNFDKFGGLIEPHYSIRQAVEDKAVVPLLYESRHVELQQNKEAIDLWFSRHTQGLSDEQRGDLKKKYARANMLNKTDQVIYMRAFDISQHFRTASFGKGTGFKAQLVAPDKASAIKYHHYLNDIGHVSSEVVISPPELREGYETVEDEPTDEVIKFWKKMMQRYGNEDNYTKNIINEFKNGSEPEILIVVDKLLTGFDAPRNTILYLCRVLREHTLLQAIARVNRLYEDKEFGYIIDYANVLEELDKALSRYDEIEKLDVKDTFTSIDKEVAQLPQHHSDLWAHFKEIKNKNDEHAYEEFLGDQEKREIFYELLSIYSKTLGIALSSEQFISTVPDYLLSRYKDDLKKFHYLRISVKKRYSDTVDYSDYEPKIKKLLDTHIQANEVLQLHAPVNIFDDRTFKKVLEDQGISTKGGKASIADTIAHATKRYITEHMGEDPVFYERFSKLVQQAIDEFKAKRLSDLDYLNQIVSLRNSVKEKKRDHLPELIRANEHASAIYENIYPFIQNNLLSDDFVAQASLVFLGLFEKYRKVDFWSDLDAQKQVKNAIDDYYYDILKKQHGLSLSINEVDALIDKLMNLANHRQIV